MIKRTLYDEIINGDIDKVATMATKEKLSLSDTDELQKRTFLYLRACLETATYPSSKGLAKSIGYSYQSLRYWRTRKRDSPTGDWLEMFADICAEIVSQSALQGNANPVSAKFIINQHLKYILRGEN